MVLRIWRPVLLATLLLGGGCGGSVEPIVTPPGCPRQPVRGPSQFASEPLMQLIDDFETGDGHLSMQGGRNGYWVIGTDGTGSLNATQASQCAGRGGWAGHFGARAWTGWGNNWTAVFQAPQNNTAVPFDARAYGAISFWAAFGPFNPVEFAVPFGVTTMDNAWNGGICNYAAGNCMDIYGTKIPLTHEWRRYVIRFEDLAQSGRGSPLVPLRKDQMVGFIIWPTQDFDMWIDDVRSAPAASADGGAP
jgi:hypothetical protein